jgi:hypothetical protein
VDGCNSATCVKISAGQFLADLPLARRRSPLSTRKSADTVQAFGRLLYIGLALLGLFGASGELSGFWGTVSKWSPVGALIKVFAGVVGPGTFDSQGWLSLLACGGYVVVLTTLGIYWFRFDAQEERVSRWHSWHRPDGQLSRTPTDLS